MASALAIKDLEMSKELSDKELSGVRGGFNFAGNGSQQIQAIAGAGSILSPVTAVGVYAPITTQIGDTNVAVNLSSLTNVLGTMVAAVQQHA